MLAFSLIFLNTLAHNKNVPESKKLKKADFIKINLASNASTEEELGEIYDAIIVNEFKVIPAYIEKIYDWVNAFSNNSKLSFHDVIKITINVISEGDVFTKFCRNGT